jgi:hypothetical protein
MAAVVCEQHSARIPRLLQPLYQRPFNVLDLRILAVFTNYRGGQLFWIPKQDDRFCRGLGHDDHMVSLSALTGFITDQEVGLKVEEIVIGGIAQGSRNNPYLFLQNICGSGPIELL